MTPENESTIATLVHLMNRADARHQQLEHDLNEATDLAAELQDQKAADLDYIQRLENQVNDLLARGTDARIELDAADKRFYDINRQYIDLRSQWAATSDALDLANEKIASLEGKMTFDELAHAWNTYVSEQPGTYEAWIDIVPIAWQAEFENFMVCMSSNQKINAIKSVRSMTGGGLKASKEFVEKKS